MNIRPPRKLKLFINIDDSTKFKDRIFTHICKAKNQFPRKSNIKERNIPYTPCAIKTLFTYFQFLRLISVSYPPSGFCIMSRFYVLDRISVISQAESVWNKNNSIRRQFPCTPSESCYRTCLFQDRSISRQSGKQYYNRPLFRLPQFCMLH